MNIGQWDSRLDGIARDIKHLREGLDLCCERAAFGTEAQTQEWVQAQEIHLLIDDLNQAIEAHLDD